MLYMTVFSTASEMLNLNNPTQTGMGSRPNESNLVPVCVGSRLILLSVLKGRDMEPLCINQ